MKKFLSIALTICLLASVSVLFASCAHTCTFSEEWTTDATAHWHVCTGKDCAEVSAKADHTFDEGVITTPATQDADGVKTYTCTACKYTKTETVAFTGMTEEEWNAAFADSVFENFTYTEESDVTTSGMTISVSTVYYFTADGALVSMEMMGQKQEEYCDGDTFKQVKEAFLASLDPIFKFADYTYDAETKSYKLTGKVQLNSSGVMLDLVGAQLKFENGRPVEFRYEGRGEANGVSVMASSVVTFTDYGTTVAEKP